MKGRPVYAIPIVVAALLVAAAWYLYSPDKDRAALEARYAPPPSQFIEAAGVRLHVRDTGVRVTGVRDTGVREGGPARPLPC